MLHSTLFLRESRPTQYQQRQSWNQDCTGWFQQVPAPFDEESIVEWTPVWSLTDRTFKYLPTDITNDLEIPTFVAITCRLDRDIEDIVLGFGTHFDPTVAIGRALTEVNQILPNVLVANANGSTKYPQAYNPLAIEWWQTATRADRSYLCPDERSPPRKKSDYIERWHDDIFADILTCQQIVESLGLEFLVLDQTRPDAGLKVAKTIIPGMRHIWKRLAPGRLYEVPVKLGWLAQPHRESQLNPFPMWM